MKTTKIIFGLAAAAVAGAAIGMLLAPEKGSDLQKRLKDGAQDWLDQVTKLVNSGKSLASDINSKAEKTISDLGRN